MTDVSAGAVPRAARPRAGLSQSVVSADESGRREPAVGPLRGLVAAAGHRLVVDLKPLPDARPRLPDTTLGRPL